MSSSTHSLSGHDITKLPDGKTFRIAIAISQYHEGITEALLQGCKDTLAAAGVPKQNIFIEHAPGAYELPLTAHWLYKHYTPDAVITLGCVIKGETSHFDFICTSVSDAIMQLGIERNVPFIFGVLTPNNYQQALDRAGGKYGNKGVEAATAALKMIALRKKLMM